MTNRTKGGKSAASAPINARARGNHQRGVANTARSGKAPVEPMTQTDSAAAACGLGRLWRLCHLHMLVRLAPLDCAARAAQHPCGERTRKEKIKP